MTYANRNFAPDGAGLAGADEAALPSWDLTDLYESPESPAIEADLSRIAGDARAFAGAYAGKLAELPGAELARAM